MRGEGGGRTFSKTAHPVSTAPLPVPNHPLHSGIWGEGLPNGSRLLFVVFFHKMHVSIECLKFGFFYKILDLSIRKDPPLAGIFLSPARGLAVGDPPYIGVKISCHLESKFQLEYPRVIVIQKNVPTYSLDSFERHKRPGFFLAFFSVQL